MTDSGGGDAFKAFFDFDEKSTGKTNKGSTSLGGTGAGTGTSDTAKGAQTMSEIPEANPEFAKFFNGEGATVEEHVDFLNKILDGTLDMNKLLEQQSASIQAKNNTVANEKMVQELRKTLENLVNQSQQAGKDLSQQSTQSKETLEQMLEEARKQMQEMKNQIVADAKKEAAEEAKSIVAPKLEIKIGDNPAPTAVLDDDIAHAEYERGLKILHTLGILWLCGPAGSGKTHLAGQLAKGFGLPFYAISCTAGLSESWFIGRKDLTGEYLEPEFLKMVENGGLVLLDEFDAADPNTSLIINSLLSNGYLSVPMRTEKPMAMRHKDFKVVIATNTWGFGPDGNYSGREGLDASTRDRAVVAKIALDYSKKIEAAFLKPTTLDFKVTPKYAYREPKNLADAFYVIRKAIKDHKIRRIMSTRAFEQAAKLKATGFTGAEILELFFADWTETEREKALNGVAWG